MPAGRARGPIGDTGCATERPLRPERSDENDGARVRNAPDGRLGNATATGDQTMDMNRRTYLKGSLGLTAATLLPPGVVALSGCSGTSVAGDVVAFGGGTMGTGYSVQLADRLAARVGTVADAPAHGGERAALEAAIARDLESIEALMSTYRPDSELSRLNAGEDGDWVPLSAPTARVLGAALDASAASDGAFDATVGPLVNLWGFGPDGTASTRPPRADVVRARERVGFGNVELDRAAGAVRKRRGDTYLDLSGIAKGHAVDRIAERLDAAGEGGYLVEIGGELRARGAKPNGQPWRVAIERPVAGRRAVHRVIELRDAAIATSGDYRNFFDAGGRRYSHSIDPRSGRPVDHGLASVSVVARTTMAADALSTALMILGPDAGLDLARRHGLAAHFVVKSSAGLEEIHTDAFERHLVA